MQRTNAKAIGLLLEEAWPQAYRIAWSILRDANEAEDAAQEACALALRAHETLRDPSAFRPWFYRIVVNEARGRRRRRPQEPIPGELQAPFDAPDDRIDVRRAIDRLDEHARLSVLLFYYVRLSTTEIANVTGSSPLAVRLRLLAARRRLRRLLAPDDVSQLAERTEREPQVAK
ncbi:MAG: sigma-70 family RNA polymerase sigma factor [Candidatus Eremiobacteraeota bacterium]|nr:sigma-70 family RNA polymerase sigma factor [Candidatus Eremiobacteraeota bacterium]